MDQREIQFTYHVYQDIAELPTVDKDLIARAGAATLNAYSPYSNFKVGAAILTENNDVIVGSNQENGSFPVGQCAERVALYRLVHEYGRIAINTIAIVVENEKQISPASPCGSCRQILNEYRNMQDQPIRLLLNSIRSTEVIEIIDVKNLLPFAFDGSFLGQ